MRHLRDCLFGRLWNGIWCDPMIREEPRIAAAVIPHAAKGVQILAVSSQFSSQWIV